MTDSLKYLISFSTTLSLDSYPTDYTKIIFFPRSKAIMNRKGLKSRDLAHIRFI
jgi:hypothetical protein